MNAKSPDLHGNAPDSSPVALLIIDMINDLEFPGGDELQEPTRLLAHAIADLKQRARELKIPVVYVNDNFGRWKSDSKEVVEHVLHGEVRGQFLAQLLMPTDEDYFVLKPKNSAFYETSLDILLTHLHVKHLILTGISTDSCVLFTANDAYMRELTLTIPSDCVASIKVTHSQDALAYMKRVLNADTTPSDRLDLEGLYQQFTTDVSCGQV